MMDTTVKAYLTCLWLFGATNALSVLSPLRPRLQTTGTLTKEEIISIQLEREKKAREKHNNDIWNTLFIPVPDRPKPTACRLPQDSIYGASCKTKLPSDFPPGCLMRIGPNGGSPEDGFLDGDGMIHCITFPPQDDPEASDPMYSATYVDTQGRKREESLGTVGKEKLSYKGSLGSAPRGLPLLQNLVWNMVTFRTLLGQKDTANTALAEHGGRVLALMEQAPPTELRIQRSGRVRTLESMSRLNGAIPSNNPVTGGTFGAHGRTCPETGDRVHVSYTSSAPPFARVDIFSEQAGNDTEGWNLKQSIPVDLRTPAMVHDCVVTRNYAVILDFPLTIRPRRFLADKFPVEYEPENGARIGLVPRESIASEKDMTVWFDCEPGVVLHAANAFETEDNKVVLHALRSQPKGDESYITDYATSFLHEWSLDLLTGETTERCLNPNELVEFPVIDDRHVGKDVDAVYCSSVSTIGGPLRVYKAPKEGITLGGVVKFALKDDQAAGHKKGDVIGRFELPENWYGVSEPTVVQKQPPADGNYVLIIATQVTEDSLAEVGQGERPSLRSQVLLLDGDNLNLGPVYALDLPYHVPYGLHSSFLKWSKMK